MRRIFTELRQSIDHAIKFRSSNFGFAYQVLGFPDEPIRNGNSWQVAREAFFDISSSWVLAYDCLTRLSHVEDRLRIYIVFTDLPSQYLSLRLIVLVRAVTVCVDLTAAHFLRKISSRIAPTWSHCSLIGR
ncbi:hypothetical protein T08_10981 [Trichinella sp. T8]|nr:hypothetical protein T08_10981 [Trichinella sp. T8]